MPSVPNPACISVLLPAYNAERYILQSVQSVLAQTFEDFELLVVNDKSTDGTLDILSSIQDRRLRVINNERNLGVVGTLNRALTEARGHYIARIDADDFCLPTRFAKQKQFLDLNPEVQLVGSEMFILEDGRIRLSRQSADPDPAVLRWQFYISNPIGHPSMMFRADIVPKLGAYLREEFKYAEDFDFSHRILRIGKIAVLPEQLAIYRLHDQNLTRTQRSDMIARGAAVLTNAYGALSGMNAAADARLAAEYLMAATPVKTVAVLEQIGDLLNRLVAAYLENSKVSESSAQRIIDSASGLWWETLQSSLRAGATIPAVLGRNYFQWSEAGRPSAYRIARSASSGLVRSVSSRLIGRDRLRQRAKDGAAQAVPKQVMLKGVPFESEQVRRYDPPSLYVVVDTEAEFDWSKPFDRSLTKVTSVAAQNKTQAIFESFGLRPVYVIDYAVASQPEGYEPLRGILERHACAIGAHLHPWINPPFEEIISAFNSFGGNLPRELEERKLQTLTAMIRKNFQVSPVFFKAGRYGLGPHTMDILHRLGFLVDFSILPKTNLAVKGGVDFRSADALPYRVTNTEILSVPMTRAHLGILAPLMPHIQSALQNQMAAEFHVPGLLSHLGLANTVTLTPEGVSLEEQMQLIRSMLRRGYRTFTLHYHSPSLVPGHTPYVKTEAELKAFLQKIESICEFFFMEVGGMPGNPADLLPPSMREKLWPQPRQDGGAFDLLEAAVSN
jgi:glycosyltransferase involved in cell wall biosynthesis